VDERTFEALTYTWDGRIWHKELGI